MAEDDSWRCPAPSTCRLGSEEYGIGLEVGLLSKPCEPLPVGPLPTIPNSTAHVGLQQRTGRQRPAVIADQCSLDQG